MPTFRRAVVRTVLDERPGLQRVEVEMADGSRAKAYALSKLTGPVHVGNPVIVNTTAVDLGLGTGGWHVVHWNLARDEWSHPGPGHVMKLRYTSLQADTGSVEELEPAMADADELDGTPVVACGLHSQVACVAVAFKAALPNARLAYVMTDGAALPLALSELVHQLVARHLIDVTITAGHAFGGDHEAINVASALVAAREVARADAVVVAMGPGVVGTATRLGFSALEVGPILDTAVALGGRPIAALRVSAADARLRHQGVSHHSVTALNLLTAARVVLPVPAGAHEAAIRADLAKTGLADRHRVFPVAGVDIATLLGEAGLQVSSMGRTVAEDPVFFSAAAAAGTAAAALVR